MALSGKQSVPQRPKVMLVQIMPVAAQLKLIEQHSLKRFPGHNYFLCPQAADQHLFQVLLNL